MTLRSSDIEQWGLRATALAKVAAYIHAAIHDTSRLRTGALNPT